MFKSFIKTFLHVAAETGKSNEDLPIALDCLDILVNKRRKQVSQQRALAFLKRLSMLALQMDSNSALAVIATVRDMMQVSWSMLPPFFCVCVIQGCSKLLLLTIIIYLLLIIFLFILLLIIYLCA